jgi:hypothetical protein
MYAVDHLARIGYDALLLDASPDYPDLDEDADGWHAAQRAAENAAVRAVLLAAKTRPFTGDRLGCTYVRPLTWPDRVPGLKCWSGQMTLAKTLAKLRDALEDCEEPDLFAARAAMLGTSGFDAGSSRDAIDIGVSPNALGMEVVQRPGVELLAVIGLETVPLVSFGPRECGYLYDGRVWRFAVELRDTGYLHRWGEVRAVEIPAADGVFGVRSGGYA